MDLAAPAILVGFVNSWFNDESTSDIEVLLKDDQTLHCHRVLLRSWSTVWAAALTDKKESSLDMTAHDADTVKLCLSYCYNFPVEMTDDNLTQVHYFAYQYNLEALMSTCEQKITQGISVANCMSLYCYFLKHSFPSMPNALEFVINFVCNEFVAIAKSKEFLSIDEEALCHLLAGPLPVPEDDVMDACTLWLGDSPDPQVRDRVLKLVRFPMLSAGKLIELRVQPDLGADYEFAMHWVLTGLVANSDRREALRAELAGENKLDNHLTPRPPLLKIESQILDDSMKSTLATMIGRNRVGRLLLKSTTGTDSAVFNGAVKNQGPFVVVIKSESGHVFGAYVDRLGRGGWELAASPNNFLFSLKNVPPQQVVKLKRGPNAYNCNWSGAPEALNPFDSHSTSADADFELAPGYERVRAKTLHGEFGVYTPELMEVFALPSM